VLGLPERAAYSSPGGRVTILEAGSATLELADPPHAEFIDQVEVGRHVAGHMRVELQVDDARAMTDRLTGAGARLIREPTRTPWNSLNSRLEAPAGLQLILFAELDSAAETVDAAPRLMHGSFIHARSLPATQSVVFAAYADLNLRNRWFRIPGDERAAVHELDFRVGGGEMLRGRFAASGVFETIEDRSRFSEIVPHERIVLTYELLVDARLRSVSLASVELAPEAGGTRLTYNEHYIFVAVTGDGYADRAEREAGERLQLNGLLVALQ
jgi:uncharacterized protein YndB with AHSA1/START domain